MDYGGFDMVKAEKMMALKKFKRKNKARKFLRYAIVALSAVLISWSSFWVPIVIQTTALYIRLACAIVASQKFIFFMCNVIILTLAAKSGQLTAGAGGSGSPDIYEEFIKNSENRPKYSTNPEPEDEEVEKKCIFEDSPVVPTPEEEEEEEKSMIEEEKKEVFEVASSNRGRYERSQSEKLERRQEKALLRSQTTIGIMETAGESSTQIVKENFSNESNDELNKRIEAFISKEKSHQREEEETLRQKKKPLAMVVQSQVN